MKKKDKGAGENKGLPLKTDQQTQELRSQAERVIRQQGALPPVDVENLTLEKSKKLLQELQVYQIELAMQNEELRDSRIELEASQARYFELYDLAPVGYLTVNEQGYITLANFTVATLLGVERSALENTPLSQYILKADQDVYYRYSKKLSDSGEDQQCELRMVKDDGAAFWVKLQGNFVPAENDGVPFCRLTLSDISERKQAEGVLRKTKFTVDKSPLSVFWTTPEGLFTYVNETAVEKLGYTHEELLSMHVWDVDPLYPQERRKEQWNLHQKERKRSIESEHRRRDGTTFPVRINIYHLVYEGQEMEVAIAEDITERNAAEENLKKIEWMLSQKQTPESVDLAEEYDQGYGDLTELNGDGIILKSISPDILRNFSNDYMELLGTSSAIYEVNGDYAFGIFSSGWCRMMDRASWQLCNTTDNIKALNSGRWLCHESCWNDCSKEAILKREPVDIECSGGIRLYAVPIIANEEVVGAINFGYGDPPEDREKLQELADTYQVNYNDLDREAHAYESRPPYIIKMAKNRLHATARLIGSMIETKQAEAKIIKSNNELEQRVKDRTIELEAVNEELASFAYSISHDFRAPLRALDGFSASLTEKYNAQLDDQGRHYLDRIRKAAIYMSDLVDDLLALSRITRTELKEQEVDLSQIADEIIEDLQEAEPERQVTVTVEPGLSAKGDFALLKAALENLIDNAWKFSSKEEQATLEVGRSTIDGEAAFFVRDNGVGFNMAYAKNLFGAFQRLHGVGEFPGTGIGLATVQRIINRHGGRIWAESEVGKGATFYFTLKN